MKETMLKLLKPAIDGFLDNLLKIEDSVKSKVKDLEKEIEDVRKQQESLKAQMQENDKRAKFNEDKLCDLRKRHSDLNEQLSREVVVYQRKAKEIDGMGAKAKNNLAETEGIKKYNSEILEKSKKAELIYKRKTELLKEDYTRLEKLQLKLREQKRNQDAKEKAQARKEIDNIDEKTRLDDFDLELKAKEANIKRLIRRKELKEMIKD